MRGYSVVAPQFWIGETGKALKTAGQEAVIVGMYLMTSPHANMLGLYFMPEIYIAYETGLGMEGASKGLRSCIEAKFCEYDKASEMVWVIEMARFQIADSLEAKDKRVKGVQNAYDNLPSNPYLEAFFEKYGECFRMIKKREWKGKSISPIHAPSKPLGSQEQEQDHGQEQDQDHLKPIVAFATGSTSPESGPPEPGPPEPGPPQTVLPGVDDGAPEQKLPEAEVIETIFDYWRKTMDSPKSKLDDKRRGVIRRALKAGYSPRDLCRAIQGCSLTPHNLGVNDRGQRYIGIHVCLKDADQIDRFMANAKAPPVAPEKKSSNVIPGWWEADDLALKQAALVGVGEAAPSESRQTWHGRIRAAIDNGGKPPPPVAPTQIPTAAVPEAPKVEATPEQKAARRAALLAVAPTLKFGKSEEHPQ